MRGGIFVLVGLISVSLRGEAFDLTMDWSASPGAAPVALSEAFRQYAVAYPDVPFLRGTRESSGDSYLLAAGASRIACDREPLSGGNRARCRLTIDPSDLGWGPFGAGFESELGDILAEARTPGVHRRLYPTGKGDLDRIIAGYGETGGDPDRLECAASCEIDSLHCWVQVGGETIPEAGLDLDGLPIPVNPLRFPSRRSAIPSLKAAPCPSPLKVR